MKQVFLEKGLIGFDTRRACALRQPQTRIVRDKRGLNVNQIQQSAPLAQHPSSIFNQTITDDSDDGYLKTKHR